MGRGEAPMAKTPSKRGPKGRTTHQRKPGPPSHRRAGRVTKKQSARRNHRSQTARRPHARAAQPSTSPQPETAGAPAKAPEQTTTPRGCGPLDYLRAIRDSRLCLNCSALANAIVLRSDRKTGHTYAAIPTLAVDAKVSRATGYKIVADLVHSGLVRRRYRKRDTSFLSLTPAIFTRPDCIHTQSAGRTTQKVRGTPFPSHPHDSPDSANVKSTIALPENYATERIVSATAAQSSVLRQRNKLPLRELPKRELKQQHSQDTSSTPAPEVRPAAAFPPLSSVEEKTVAYIRSQLPDLNPDTPEQLVAKYGGAHCLARLPLVKRQIEAGGCKNPEGLFRKACEEPYAVEPGDDVWARSRLQGFSEEPAKIPRAVPANSPDVPALADAAPNAAENLNSQTTDGPPRNSAPPTAPKNTPSIADAVPVEDDDLSKLSREERDAWIAEGRETGKRAQTPAPHGGEDTP